jgi:hypothetical protein
MEDTLTTKDIIDIALHGGKIPIDRALATYANPDNWRQINDEKGCHWVWNGPVICAYELAEMSIRFNKE